MDLRRKDRDSRPQIDISNVGDKTTTLTQMHLFIMQLAFENSALMNADAMTGDAEALEEAMLDEFTPEEDIAQLKIFLAEYPNEVADFALECVIAQGESEIWQLGQRAYMNGERAPKSPEQTYNEVGGI